MKISTNLSGADSELLKKISELRNESVDQTVQFVVRAYLAAQQDTHLTAEGVGFRKALSLFIIRWGWRIAKLGGR